MDAERVHFDRVAQPWLFPDAGPSRIAETRIKNQPEKPPSSTKGWRRLGPPLPAFCPRCKCVFPSRSYEIRNPRFLSKDNEETCRNCGFEHAKVSDGLFELTTDVLHVIDAPDFTHAMLASLVDLASSVVNEKIDAAEAVDCYTQISPTLGQIAKSALSIGASALMYISAAAAIYGAVLQKEALTISQEQLKLQRESNASSDQALERTLGALSEIKFTLERLPSQIDQKQKTDLGESKVEKQKGQVELKPKRKIKAREARRQIEAARRQAFNPRPGKP